MGLVRLRVDFAARLLEVSWREGAGGGGKGSWGGTEGERQAWAW